MISWVSKKVEVRDSDINGRGTFALQDIPKGEIVIVQGGSIVHDEDFEKEGFNEYCYHCFQVEKDHFICPLNKEKDNLDSVFKVNHSCEPNCGWRGQIVLLAMRDIKSGEEITYDYAMTDVGDKDDAGWVPMTCLCKTPSCRKFITGWDWENKDLQKKYAGFFSEYIERLIRDNK